ncbi:hypothetical protein [Methylobacterium radiotolerans]|nr:hypothetical protein [Methylobacterium radiotolerans]
MEIVTPLHASLLAVEEMMAASRARRKAELKNLQEPEVNKQVE